MAQMVFAAVTSVILAVLTPSLLLASPFDQEQAAVVLMVNEGAEHEERFVTLKSQDGVRQMELEEYIVGVVFSEMPASFHEEALKAQAVAARTFTMYRMEHQKHKDAAVCSDSGCCQAWSDIDEMEDKLGNSGLELIERVRRAVRQTKGECLIYNEALIETPFFSCSGGKTEAAVAVWGNEVPYLQSVDSVGEDTALRFEGEEVVSVDEFKRVLLNYDSTLSVSDPVEEWIGNITYTSGAGVDTIEICGKQFRGTELRGLFGLNSTAFNVELHDNAFVFHTKGFGHRVGMSQHGANAMAERGADYTEILQHYYQGVEIRK